MREQARQRAIDEGSEIEESLREENDLQAAKATGTEHTCFLQAWFATGVQPDSQLSPTGSDQARTSPPVTEEDGPTHDDFRPTPGLGQGLNDLAGLAGLAATGAGELVRGRLMGGSSLNFGPS